MAANPNEWLAARVFHLMGGMRAVNMLGPEIDFRPGTVEGGSLKVQAKQYRSAFGAIAKVGPPIVGVDFLRDSELGGKAPPDWRVFQRGWPSWETRQKWADIANSAFLTRHGYAWDLASRTSQQHRICCWRLRQVSNAYSSQLVARPKGGELKAGCRFEDGFTALGYIALQSYLVDACVLRDCLAEFVANMVWSSASSGGGTAAVSTMSGLIKIAPGTVAKDDPIWIAILAATQQGGWLWLLGHYRDLVVHTAPLATAGARLFAVVEHHRVAEGRTLPMVRLPLPKEPDKIRACRANRSHFSDFAAQFDAFLQAIRETSLSIDGLEYLAQAHGKLAELSALILSHSPIAGKRQQITDADIVDDVKISDQTGENST